MARRDIPKLVEETGITGWLDAGPPYGGSDDFIGGITIGRAEVICTKCKHIFVTSFTQEFDLPPDLTHMKCPECGKRNIELKRDYDHREELRNLFKAIKWDDRKLVSPGVEYPRRRTRIEPTLPVEPAPEKSKGEEKEHPMPKRRRYVLGARFK